MKTSQTEALYNKHLYVAFRERVKERCLRSRASSTFITVPSIKKKNILKYIPFIPSDVRQVKYVFQFLLKRRYFIIIFLF